ncbi:hypothetical protein FGO68_gene2169 [Halteria grandinella]|uniref:Uncharacterized protein n=1 Tax=Halteria grandinella TaxID=5974 RepID=A0A8J8NZC1_HALGN|nr:hypothetical protein FGO68_gene2169 [Halteria grandinella]
MHFKIITHQQSLEPEYKQGKLLATYGGAGGETGKNVSYNGLLQNAGSGLNLTRPQKQLYNGQQFLSVDHSFHSGFGGVKKLAALGTCTQTTPLYNKAESSWMGVISEANNNSTELPNFTRQIQLKQNQERINNMSSGNQFQQLTLHGNQAQFEQDISQFNQEEDKQTDSQDRPSSLYQNNDVHVEATLHKKLKEGDHVELGAFLDGEIVVDNSTNKYEDVQEAVSLGLSHKEIQQENQLKQIMENFKKQSSSLYLAPPSLNRQQHPRFQSNFQKAHPFVVFEPLSGDATYQSEFNVPTLEYAQSSQNLQAYKEMTSMPNAAGAFSQNQHLSYILDKQSRSKNNCSPGRYESINNQSQSRLGADAQNNNEGIIFYSRGTGERRYIGGAQMRKEKSLLEIEDQSAEGTGEIIFEGRAISLDEQHQIQLSFDIASGDLKGQDEFSNQVDALNSKNQSFRLKNIIENRKNSSIIVSAGLNSQNSCQGSTPGSLIQQVPVDGGAIRSAVSDSDLFNHNHQSVGIYNNWASQGPLNMSLYQIGSTQGAYQMPQAFGSDFSSGNGQQTWANLNDGSNALQQSTFPQRNGCFTRQYGQILSKAYTKWGTVNLHVIESESEDDDEDSSQENAARNKKKCASFFPNIDPIPEAANSPQNSGASFYHLKSEGERQSGSSNEVSQQSLIPSSGGDSILHQIFGKRQASRDASSSSKSVAVGMVSIKDGSYQQIAEAEDEEEEDHRIPTVQNCANDEEVLAQDSSDEDYKPEPIQPEYSPNLVKLAIEPFEEEDQGLPCGAQSYYGQLKEEVNENVQGASKYSRKSYKQSLYSQYDIEDSDEFDEGFDEQVVHEFTHHSMLNVSTSGQTSMNQRGYINNNDGKMMQTQKIIQHNKGANPGSSLNFYSSKPGKSLASLKQGNTFA